MQPFATAYAYEYNFRMQIWQLVKYTYLLKHQYILSEIVISGDDGE